MGRKQGGVALKGNLRDPGSGSAGPVQYLDCAVGTQTHKGDKIV